MARLETWKYKCLCFLWKSIDRERKEWYINYVAPEEVRTKAGEEMTLEELKNSSFVVGMKETERALEKGEAVYVFIASDCDDRISSPLKEACSAKGVSYSSDYAKKDIGKACGIKVKAAACAVLGTR